MKENLIQMQERHKNEIDELQRKCRHTDITDWVDYMWAPGHFGVPVKVCKFCGKVMDRKMEFKG